MRENSNCETGGEFGMSGIFEKINKNSQKNLNVRRAAVKMGGK